jgi:hypothetical protein
LTDRSVDAYVDRVRTRDPDGKREAMLASGLAVAEENRHCPFAEAPEQFLAAVLPFLRLHVPAGSG